MIIHLSYLFKHVAGSVASPLHMMEYYRSKVCPIVVNESIGIFCLAVFPRIRQQAAAVSTPSSDFIAALCTMTENWPITPQWERERAMGKWTDRERKEKEVRKMSETKGVVHRGPRLKQVQTPWGMVKGNLRWSKIQDFSLLMEPLSLN